MFGDTVTSKVQLDSESKQKNGDRQNKINTCSSFVMFNLVKSMIPSNQKDIVNYGLVIPFFKSTNITFDFLIVSNLIISKRFGRVLEIELI